MTAEISPKNNLQSDFMDLVKHYGRYFGLSGLRSGNGEPLVLMRSRPGLEELAGPSGIPGRIVPENCRLVQNPYSGYPYDETVRYVNKDTGLVEVEIYYYELSLDGIKQWRPGMLVKNWYREVSYYHPILNEEMEGYELISKSWLIDKRYRRRSRDKLMLRLVVFDGNWDPGNNEGRKIVNVLVESEYEEIPGQENLPVNAEINYREIWRSYLLSGVHTYAASKDRTVLTYYGIPKADITGSKSGVVFTRTTAPEGVPENINPSTITV